MYILKLLTVLLLIVFPFGELLRIDFSNNIFLKPLDVIVGLITIWAVIHARKNKKKILNWKLLLFPLVGLLALLINSIWLKPNELLPSGLYLIRWVGYSGIFFAVLQFDNLFRKKLLAFLFIDGLIILILGFIQYFFYSDLRNLYYLGWDDHMHRMFSTFLDPNFAGVFFVLYFFFILGLVVRDRKNMKRFQVYLFSIILLLTLIAIFLTYSRSALLMLIASSAIFFVLIGKKKLILLLLGVIALFIVVVSPNFNIENTNLFRVNSSKARIETTQNAIKIIQNYPILGVGFNSYRYIQQRYGFREEQPPFPSHADSGVDNSFLFILATTGIIGFGAYGILLKTFLTRAYVFYRKKANIFALVVIASTMGLFINAFFINSLFFPAVMLWMGMMVGFMEAEK